MTTQFTKCLLVFTLSLGVAACGLTGPLYMPPPEPAAPAAKQEAAQPKTEKAAAEKAATDTSPAATPH